MKLLWIKSAIFTKIKVIWFTQSPLGSAIYIAVLCTIKYYGVRYHIRNEKFYDKNYM